MNESLKVLCFQDSAVRIVSRENEIFFLANDVCRALEIEGERRAVNEVVDEDEVIKLSTPDALGRLRETNYLTESGLYTLILRSDKPKAKEFRRWVTKEVLPAIRKTGGYGGQLRLEELWSAFEEARTGAAQVAVLELIAQVAGFRTPLQTHAGPRERIEPPPPTVDELWADLLILAQETPDRFNWRTLYERFYMRATPLLQALKDRFPRYHGMSQYEFCRIAKTSEEWIGAKNDVHRQRFPGSRTPHGCWCFSISARVDAVIAALRRIGDGDAASITTVN